MRHKAGTDIQTIWKKLFQLERHTFGRVRHSLGHFLGHCVLAVNLRAVRRLRAHRKFWPKLTQLATILNYKMDDFCGAAGQYRSVFRGQTTWLRLQPKGVAPLDDRFDLRLATRTA